MQLQHQMAGCGMPDLDEKSAETELNHHAQPRNLNAGVAKKQF